MAVLGSMDSLGCQLFSALMQFAIAHHRKASMVPSASLAKRSLKTDSTSPARNDVPLTSLILANEASKKSPQLSPIRVSGSGLSSPICLNDSSKREKP